MSEETPKVEEKPKVKMTKKAIQEQIQTCRTIVEQNIGIVKYCENLLQNAELPEE